MPKVDILWLKINTENEDEIAAMIDGLVQARKPSQVVTVNPEFFYLAKKDDELREIFNEAAISTCDGMGVYKASQMLRTQPRIKSRVSGADLFWTLMKIASEKQYRVFFLGAQPGVADRAAEVVRARYPAIPPIGAFAGFPSIDRRLATGGPDDPNREILDLLRQAKPDMLFVAYGCPKQDKFISYYKDILGIPVSIGVGGTLDFVAGTAKRAPLWLQQSGFEWAFRSIQDPKRLKRQVPSKLYFLAKVLQEMMRTRSGTS